MIVEITPMVGQASKKMYGYLNRIMPPSSTYMDPKLRFLLTTLMATAHSVSLFIGALESERVLNSMTPSSTSTDWNRMPRRVPGTLNLW